MAIFRGIGGAGDSTTDATVTAVTQQATNAANSATAAASSASSASNSASAAYSSSTSASSSASSAASSASNASASADAALAALDNFDDRYLGQKASAPTLDNDGGALITGALYFNTTTNEMKVYDGSAWLNAYASLSGALLATSNLSDLNDANAARTNLGVAIGSDVQAYNANTVIDASYVHTDNNYTTTEKNKLATALITSTTFSGDVSGTYNAIVVADDSHNHIISNVDGLQTALDGKAPLTGTGASGTWGISITGNAATVTNGLYTTSTIDGGTF